MAYERVNWENLPSTKTPINQTNLNKMDEGIDAKQDKLTAGTGIEITGTNIINNLNANYSTEEQRVGTWIDGKPLYRKIISSTLPRVATDGTNVASTVPINANIDFGYIEKAFYTDIYSGRITLPWITGSGGVIRAYLDVPGQQISLLSNAVDVNERPVTIIVCYTKTTD